MSRASCIAALMKENIELDRAQLDGVADFIEGTIESAKTRNLDVFSEVQKAIDDYVDSLDGLVNVVKKNEALNFQARNQIQTYVGEHWADSPAEGLRTLLTGVQADRPGAKDAVSVLQAQLADKYIGDMRSRLETPGPDGRKPLDYVKPTQ